MERGTLYYRAAESGAPFTTRALISSGSAFISVIPGEAVTESGLEYYVTVENSGIVNTDPLGAPGDSLYFQEVQAPEAVSAIPISSSGDVFFVDEGIVVELTLPAGARFQSGELHFRSGGKRSIRS